MGLISKEKAGGGGFDPVPQGTHIARCTTVVDLGVQTTPWGEKQQVYLGFEIPGTRVKWTKDDVEHEGAALIGATWTNNLYEEANLGKNLISWRGKAFTAEERKGFDLFNLLGVPCMISVTHTTKGEKTSAKIASIMGIPKGTTVPPQESESLGYTADDPAFAGNLSKLPEWLQKKVSEGKKEEEYDPAPPAGYDAPPDFDDSIPF